MTAVESFVYVGDPVEVVVADGYLWAALNSGVSQVDPVTETVLTEILIPGTSFYTDIRAAFGYVWTIHDESIVSRIDPATASITGTLTTAAPFEQTVVGAASALLTFHGSYTGEWFNPTSLASSGSVTFSPSGSSTSRAHTDGSSAFVLVTSGSTDRIHRYASGSSTPDDTLVFGTTSTYRQILGYGFGTLWVLRVVGGVDMVIERLDPTDLSTVSSFTLPDPASGVAIGFDANYAWIAQGATLRLYDPADNTLAETVILSGGVVYTSNFEYLDGSMWTADPLNGNVIRIGPATDPDAPPEPIPPVASFTVTPTSGESPFTIDVDASASTDPDGTVVSYDWEYGFGGDTGTGVTDSYLIDVESGGVLTVTLTVTDNDGLTDSTSQLVTVTVADEAVPETTLTLTGDCSDCDSDAAVIEGQLGSCRLARYTVDLMSRGGEIRLDTFESVIDVRWERRLDAISSASIEVAKRNSRCCAQIEAADPYATELCIRRDGVIVFEGPVYEVGESRDTAVILARDVSHWLERRIVRSSIDDSTVPPDAPIGTEPGRDGTLIARDIIRAGFKFDDPNVLDWLYVIDGADITARKTDAAQRPYAFNELSDVARTSVDWTVAGRRMFVMPAQHPLGVLARLTDDDIVGDYTITRMGRDYASRQITVGQGALRAIAGGKSNRYGLVEQVNQEQSLTTQAAVDNAANVQYRVTPRPPIWVSLDDGVALKPTAPVTIDELIPGVVFPGQFTQRCQTIQQDFRLQKVSVEFNEGVEQVSIDAVAVGYAFESPDAAYQTGIAIGDSLTALNPDLQNTEGGRWVDILADSGYVANLRSFAIPSATSQTMIDAPLVEPQPADLFIVFFGANDMNTGIPELMVDEITPAEYGDNIAWYLENYPAGRQVVVFPWRWTGFPVPGGPVDEATYQAYRAAAITTANRYGAAFVDMGANTASPVPYIVDWIHANERGHQRIASFVRAVL